MRAPYPDNEAARLESLRAYNILDTPPEESFDEITRLAAAFCDTPVCLITLIDQARQWFKSCVGFAATETPRDIAICAHAILQKEILVVPDAVKDVRFTNNPLVAGEPHVRFYAGVPLITPGGDALGTLCVVDFVPRDLSPQQTMLLETLAHQVVAQLELRRKIQEQERIVRLQQAAEQALRDTQSRFEAFMNTSPFVAFMKDTGGRYMYVNQMYERVFNIALENIRGATDFERFSDEVAQQNRQNDEAVRRAGKPVESIETVPTADGVVHTWSVCKFPFADPGGGYWVGGVAIDITDRKNAEEALRLSESRLAEAQSVAQIGSWDFEVATGKLFWSEQMFRLLELDPSQGPPTFADFTHCYHPDDRPMHNRIIQSALKKGNSYEFDIRGMTKGKGCRWFHAVGRAVCDASGRPERLTGTLRDITEAKELARQVEAANECLEEANKILIEQQAALIVGHMQLERLATTDGLTGLKNYRAFQEQLAEEFDRSRRYGVRLSIILLDVDYFKLFNDAYGHPAGDQVLKRVAAVLQRSARATNFVARYGGEEFVIMLPETDAAGAATVADRIRRDLAEEPWEHREITMSAGISSMDVTTESPSVLLDQTDQALYASKATGRNRATLFQPGMDARIVYAAKI